MFALDLFNTKYEKELKEGAVDSLEARRIDDLNMKMLDLLGRVKEPAYKKNPKALAGLKKQFQKIKAERDNYFKINSAAGMNSSGTLGTTKGALDERSMAGDAQRQPKFDPKTGQAIGAQLSEFEGDVVNYPTTGTPTQSTPTTQQPPRRGYSIILTGRPGRDWMAEYAWQALETVLPRDYPGDSIAANVAANKLPPTRAMLKVKEAHNGPVAVKLGIASEDIAETIVSRLAANRIPAQYWRIASQDLDEGQGTAQTRGVDAKGRTQAQWLQLVKAKFPNAKIMQAKMIDGPVQVTLPDGRQIGWSKVEQTVAEERRPYGDYPQSPRAFGAGNFQRIVRANMGNLPTVTLEFPEPKDNINLDKKGLSLISDYYDSLTNDSLKNYFIYRVLPSADEVLTVLKKLGWNQAVQPELPGIPAQGELPLQEKKKFDRNSDVVAGDTKVARELQKLRAQYPAAKSDVEAVAKAEIDSNERSQQQLSAIKGANTEQDRLLQQLIALDKKQGTEIGSLDNEKNRLEQQLAHVEQTNAKLAQAVDQITKQAQSRDDVAPQSQEKQAIDLLPTVPTDTQTQPQSPPATEPENTMKKSNSKSDAMSRMAQSLGSQPRRVQGIDRGPAPSIRGDNITDISQYRNDAVRRAQAAIADKNFAPLANQLVNKGVVTRTGTDESLNEFAPSAGGSSGDYFQALASAWYNGAFDTGSLQKGIKSKEDVERLLDRGIIGPDGVTRKYAIDYNSTFEGVVISSDDYYEHSDYNDQGQEVDSRNGRPWGPYDYMEFDDEELDESAKYRGTKGVEVDEQGVVEKIGDLRPKLGSRRDQGKSVRKWRLARGLDESGVAEASNELAVAAGTLPPSKGNGTWVILNANRNVLYRFHAPNEQRARSMKDQWCQENNVDSDSCKLQFDGDVRLGQPGNTRRPGPAAAATSNRVAAMTTMGMGNPLDFSSDYALYTVQKGRELFGTMRNLYAKANALPPAERDKFYKRLDAMAYEGLGDEILRYSKTLTVEDLVAITDVLENYDIMFNTIAIPDELKDVETAWKQYAAEVALARTQAQPGQTMHERSMAEGSLNEFSLGGDDDKPKDDPYRYPKPEHFSRSIDFFGQFEADHFDKEDMNDATGEFKGYWDYDGKLKQIAYFKFDNPKRTSSNHPGMGWYYEPESSSSDNSIAAPAADNADERKQQELSMISQFLKSSNRPNPNSQIGQLMKKHGMTEGQVNELSSDLLRKAAQVAKNKSDRAMDPKIHDALGGGYMNPLAKHYDTMSDKFSNRAAKVGQKDAVKKIASPAAMRKIGIAEQGVAEGGSRYDDNRTGFGKRSREDDEYHVPDPVETQYNIKVSGRVINRQPFANRAAAVAWAKQAVASGKLDLKTATLSPINQVNELSTDKLAQYKKAAGADATAADKRGDYERGNKRFKGIVKATIKQGNNDLKKHRQQGMAEGWKDEADDFTEWSNHVKEKLSKASPEQRLGLAKQLSQLEVKHFGSTIPGTFNKQTGKAQAGLGLTDTVRNALKYFNARQYTDQDLPAGTFGDKFGSVTIDGMENATPAELALMAKAVRAGADYAKAAGRIYRKTGTITQQDLDKIKQGFEDNANKFAASVGAQMDYSNRPEEPTALAQASLARRDQAVAESTGPGVDAKGRTQSQWIQLVKAKFPDGKMIQAKMPDGPVQVILPDGRKLGWKKVEQAVAEGSSTASEAVERAILNRIMVQHTDLLMQFGPEKVMQAAEEVSYNVGDVDEIGTSDVNAYVNQVRQILGVEA